VLCAAVAPLTKMSGVVFLPVMAGLLVVRAMTRRPWACFGREVARRGGKLAIAAAVIVASLGTAYLLLWANYSFRYAPTPDGRTWDLATVLRELAINDLVAQENASGHETVTVPEEKVAKWQPPASVRTLLFLDRHRLLPQAWTYGALFTYRSTRLRASYLMGRVSYVGFPGYFAFTYLFKTPIATQMAVLLAAFWGARGMVRKWRKEDTVTAGHGWAMLCVAGPLLVIGAATLLSRVNIGIRHELPLYPFLYVAAGWSAARVWEEWGRNGRVLLLALLVGLAAETVAAFPNYVPFFNVACGGARGGLKLLGDSNLDWGQDLPLLAEWQRRHPEKNLYLCYFGTAEPGYYGIRYTPLPGSDAPRATEAELAKRRFPTMPGVIAISATQLQGIYLEAGVRKIYEPLFEQRPMEVLGGTIYLFEWDPR
jgi:hypothetical protein